MISRSLGPRIGVFLVVLLVLSAVHEWWVLPAACLAYLLLVLPELVSSHRSTRDVSPHEKKLIRDLAHTNATVAGALDRAHARIKLEMAEHEVTKGNLAERRCALDTAHRNMASLSAALVELDRVAGAVLEASIEEGVDEHQMVSALHTLDEVRGRMWARYDAASAELKRVARH